MRPLSLVCAFTLALASQAVVPIVGRAAAGLPATQKVLRAIPKRHVARHLERQLSEVAVPGRVAQGTRSARPGSSTALMGPVLGGSWSELGPKPIASAGAPEGENAGRVTSIAVDPTNSAIVYAGTADGGVWKSTNGTSTSPTWVPLTDSQATLAIGAIAVDPNNPATIYAGTGEANRCGDCLPSQGVMKSVDGGANWTLLAGSPVHRTTALVVDRGNSNNVLVATTRGLYQSLDGGGTWTQNTQINSVTAVNGSGKPITGGVDSLVQDPVTPTTLWAALGDWCDSEKGSIVVSRDSGATWAESTSFSTAPTALPNASRIALGLGKDGTNHVYGYAAIAACPSPLGATTRYDDGQLIGIAKNADMDGSGSWSVLTPGSPATLVDYFAEPPPGTSHQGWYDTMVAVDPTNPLQVIFGGVTVLLTKDGGASFSDIARPYSTDTANPPLLHPDFHAAVFTGAGAFYVGNDGGVWSTTNLGTSYTNLNHTLSITQFYAGASQSSAYLVGGSQDNGSLGLVPGGPAPPAWKMLLDGDGGWSAIDPTSGSKTVWSELTHLDMYRGTYDTNGSTWSETGPCGTAGCTESTDFTAPFLMDPGNPSRLYAGSTFVYRTIDNGTSWTKVSPDLTFGNAFAPDADALHTMALATGGGSTAIFSGSYFGMVSLNTAADSTSNWTDITANLPPHTVGADTGNAWVSGLAANPTNPSEAWVTISAASGGRVWHTTNAGAAGGTVWTDITGTVSAVPAGIVDTVTVDPKNPSTVFIGTDAGAFVCGTCAGATAAGSWSPLGSGLPNVRVDAITLTHDDATIVAWTHGRGAWSMPSGPRASLDPTSLAFGSQAAGTVSPTQPITLTDTGTQPLVITGISVSGDYSQTNNCGAALLPGANCTINVAFGPTSTGTRTGTLSVADNAGDSPQTAALTGTGTAAPNPYGSLSPGSMDFGNQEVGSTSQPKSATLTNSGSMPLVIQNITVPNGFSESDDCTSPSSSLAPGASCTINLSFTPPARGSQGGKLTVTDNGTNSPQTADLHGTGVQALASLSPTSLDFGNQHVGSTSGGRNVTLTNGGNEALNINGITASGDFGQTNNCGSSLAANGSCTITVTFTPSVPGTRSGTLSVSDSASGSPQTASLSGTGTQAQASLSPASLTFAAEDVGTTSQPQAVTLSNVGNESLAINGISASADFGQGNNCGQSVAPGASCTITVTFMPSSAGSRTGSLTVSDNAPASPQAVPLSGHGTLSFYFAEGFTASGFTESLSLLAPNHDALATIDYYTPSTHSTVRVPLKSGEVWTEPVNRDVGPDQKVSAKVTLDQMGVVERTMHFNFGSWHGSTNKVGVTSPSREWDFAEGSTLPFFNEYLTLQNPGSTDVLANVRYITDRGETPIKSLTLPAGSRTTVAVFDGAPVSGSCSISAGDAVACGVGRGYVGVSVQVTAAQPIIVERPFYVSGHSFGSGAIRDGHDAFGANSPAMEWQFAEGTTLPGFNEYLTLQNPSASDSIVDLHYYSESGLEAIKTVTLPGNHRTTVEVFSGSFTSANCSVINGMGVGCGVGPGLTGVAVTVTVHSGYPAIVAERPIYMVHDFGSGTVAGADDIVGATQLRQTFGFAWGSTVSGDNDYLTIENPGALAGSVTITYYGPTGPIAQAVTISMAAHLRRTIHVWDPPILGGTGPTQSVVGIVISSTVPIQVEKPTYSSNSATYGATDTGGYSPDAF